MLLQSVLVLVTKTATRNAETITSQNTLDIKQILVVYYVNHILFVMGIGNLPRNLTHIHSLNTYITLLLY